MIIKTFGIAIQENLKSQPSSLTDSLDYIVNTIKSIKTFLDYLTHPAKVFLFFWNLTLEFSYIACLLICIISVMLYIFGHKKAARLAPISIGIYTLIQAIGGALK